MLARLGFITELLSKPIRYGYMNGIALTVLLSQIPKLLGFSVDASGPGRQAWAIVQGVFTGSVNGVALAIGGGALALILMLKRWPRVPGLLIAVVCAHRRGRRFDLATSAGVVVLGPLPQGLPAPRLPIVGFDDLMPVLTGGAAVALVAFADTSVLSRTYAARLRTTVDPNQEMAALGRHEPGGGFLQGFPDQQQHVADTGRRGGGCEDAADRGRGGAWRRVAPSAGARAAPGSPTNRPGRRRHRLRDRLDRNRRPSTHLSHPTLGVLAVDGLLRRRRGVWRDSGHRVRDRDRRDRVPLGRLAPALGRAGPSAGHQGLSRHHPVSGRAVVPGLVLFRWDAPLFFANAELFHQRVVDAVASAPPPIRWVVVAAEPVTSVDVTAADAVVELDDQLSAAGIELCFAEMKDPVKDKLKRFGLFEHFGEHTFFATIDEAVSAYLAAHRVDWVDEERTRER